VGIYEEFWIILHIFEGLSIAISKETAEMRKWGSS
jgi:hypothetical protein